MAAKFELDWPKWNNFVSDTTQCTLLTHEEEVKFLSSKDPACELSPSSTITPSHPLTLDDPTVTLEKDLVSADNILQ